MRGRGISVTRMWWLPRLLRRLGPMRAFMFLGSRLAAPLDRFTYRLTRQRRILTPKALPSLLLLLPGRRPVPLLWVPHGNGEAVVGTNFGSPHHPSWTTALLRNPEFEVFREGATSPRRARLLTGPDRAAAWSALCGLWPGYLDYERRSGREVRVFALEPPA